MYGRILEREIPLPSSEAQPAKPAAEGPQPRLGLPASRLAAALGLSHLFRWPPSHPGPCAPSQSNWALHT